MITYIIIGLIMCIAVYALACFLKSAVKVIAVVLVVLLAFSYWGYALNKEETISLAVKIKDRVIDSRIFGYFKEKANDTLDSAVDITKERLKEALE